MSAVAVTAAAYLPAGAGSEARHPTSSRLGPGRSAAGSVVPVSEDSENIIDVGRETPGAQGSPASEAGSGPLEDEPPTGRDGRPWKTVALVVGTGALSAVGAVVVTLAATHKSAVAHNARAYANGLLDGYQAHKREL